MYTITNNTPSAGCIQWTNLGIQYKGTNYSIANGYTNAAYVYWLASSPTVLVASNTYPTLGNDDCLVFLNKSGTALVVPGSTALNGGLIVPGTILANAIASNTITGDKLVAGTISGTYLAADCVGADKIAANAVLAENIKAGAVTTDKIAAGAITAAKIAAAAISADKLAANAVTADKISAGAITTAKLAAGSVTASHIAAGTITADKLASNVGTALNLASNTAITSLVSSVAGIEIGGRNYILKSGQNGYVLDDEYSLALPIYDNVGSFAQMYNLSVPMSTFAGRTVTVSMWIRSPNGAATIQIYNANGNPRYALVVPGTGAGSISVQIPTTAWHFVSATFFVYDHGTDASFSEAASDKIELYVPTRTGAIVKHLQFETGNKATDWTPAPEDMDTRVANVSTALAQTADALQAKITNGDSTTLVRAALDGVYVGRSDSATQTRVSAGSFDVLVGGSVTTSLGDKRQKLGSLVIYETSDGGHAFV